MLFSEGLVAIDGHGKPTARLASSWEWDEKDKGLTLRVHLRPGVRFHDDTPVTADVVAAILRAKKAKAEGFETVKSIEAVDAQTVLFHLTRPDGFLPSALANSLIVDEKKPDIGTGPFRLVGKNPLEAVRNESYYRGTPGFQRIMVRGYPTPRAAWVGLMKGEVDLAMEINKESVEFLEGAAQFEKYSSLQPYYIPLVFNLRNPVLARPEVRRAISDAIDRKEIVAQGMRGRGQVADDPIWPLHWSYNPTVRRDPPSPSAASLRLEAAGLPIREAKPGQRASRFQLKCMFFNGDPQFERIALLLQRQLAAVGIDLVLEGLKQSDMVPRIQAGQFDSYLFQLTSGRDLIWAYRLWHSPNGGIWQNTGYSGADAVLDGLRRARDDQPQYDEEIRRGVADLRQRFYDDVPAVFLAWTETTRAVDARFDIGNGADPEILANMYQWRPGSAQTASR